MQVVIIRRGLKQHRIPIPEKFRRRFEKNHGPGSAARLFEALGQPEHDFASIGKSLNISREAVRRHYDQRLARFLPERNGRERREAVAKKQAGKRTQKGIADSIKRVHPAAKATRQAAHDNGVPTNWVSTHLYGHRWHTSSTRLRIDSKRSIIIHHIRGTTIHGCRRYARCTVCWDTLKRQETHVFAVEIPKGEYRFFVVPSRELREACTSRDQYGRTYFYIPLQPYSKRNRALLLNWPSYRDAWHLLRKTAV